MSDTRSLEFFDRVAQVKDQTGAQFQQWCAAARARMRRRRRLRAAAAAAPPPRREAALLALIGIVAK